MFFQVYTQTEKQGVSKKKKTVQKTHKTKQNWDLYSIADNNEIVMVSFVMVSGLCLLFF